MCNKHVTLHDLTPMHQDQKWAVSQHYQGIESLLNFQTTQTMMIRGLLCQVGLRVSICRCFFVACTCAPSEGGILEDLQ